jgi:hypothetical protein
MDTVELVPVEALSHLHMDPDHPVPGSGDGMALVEFDVDAIDALVCATVGSPLLSVEVRQLGGAIGRTRADHGSVASLEAPFLLYAVGIAPTPEAARAVERTVAGLRSALAGWESSQTYLNFAETKRDGKNLWSETSYRRLRRIKAAVDPHNRIRSNHEL